ncbi:MAG: hypothetical protein HLUCCX10_15490 [Algoriphagus marincola HL-49]|uniref:6-bladed beta-propeller n=1 Tax=Algoriphagus marincola HL-49 TaxID=1305737 RepID=A0A0P8A0M8_9BACT|nr:MAG: hypothetical protein HLUCCX10_15490 [Algoriphagus marincola HL-49]
MRNILFLIISSFLIFACANVTDKDDIGIYTVRVDDKAETLKMSSIIDTVKVIPLDNREIVGSVDEIIWAPDRIIILDSKRTKKIFIYSQEGQLITSIESGSGEPEKFVWPYAPTLSLDKESFYVVSDRTKRLLHYDLDGVLLEDFDISHLGQVNDMIVTKKGFAFSTKPDSQVASNIIFTDFKLQISGEIRASEFYEQLPFVSGIATNSFYQGEEVGHFYYQEIMTNMILEVKDEKVIRVIEIDLPDSYEVDYAKVGRSIPEVVQYARENGLVKLNENHIYFGAKFLIDLSNSGRGALGFLDLENYQMKFISNLKNDLSILIDVNAVWGAYNNEKEKLVTVLEAPIMTRLLQSVDYSQSAYASIFDSLSVKDDDNPTIFVYELKKDFAWHFD